MREIKTLLKYMKGNKTIYLMGIIFVIFSELFTVLSPLVIRTAIDFIIGDEEINSHLIANIIDLLGGKDFLRKNLWIIGIILIAAATLRGAFMFLKSYLSSKSAENTIKSLRDTVYDHIQRLP